VEIGWMIGLLVLLLVACIIIWAARTLMRAWNVGEPFATTVYVILVVLFAVAFLMRMGYVSSIRM
jgi:cell division protein FtsW (lipid II flippase)